MKLAEALVLRKHLILKVQQLQPLKLAGDNGMLNEKIERRNVTETIDEVTLKTPRVDLATITAEYDKYSKALRELDTAIQATNWSADLVGGPANLDDLKV